MVIGKKTKYRLLSIIVGTVIFVLITHYVSCKIPKQSVSPNITNDFDKPLIVFLGGSILYDSVYQIYQMKLTDKVITKGRIKKQTNHPTIYKENRLKYCLLDKNNQIISSFYMQNPLDKTVEYIDENSGLMRTRSIRLNNAPFSLRIQLTSHSKYICFEKDNQQLLLVDIDER